MRDDGTANTSFTLYGHMYAGAPDRVEIYKPGDKPGSDVPVKTVPFKVTPPKIEIVLHEENGYAWILVDVVDL